MSYEDDTVLLYGSIRKYLSHRHLLDQYLGEIFMGTWGEGAFKSRDSILEQRGIFPIIQEIGLLCGER
jgi:hypothetical protein